MQPRYRARRSRLAANLSRPAMEHAPDAPVVSFGSARVVFSIGRHFHMAIHDLTQGSVRR